MKKEVLSYSQEEFDFVKEYFASLDYNFLSLSIFIDHITDIEFFQEYENGIHVIDISILGEYELKVQSICENILNRLKNESLIFICDRNILTIIKYNLRFCFEKFTDFKDKYDIRNTIDKHIHSQPQIQHRKITDLSNEEFESFFTKFNEILYGHEKFKTDFYELAKSFRLFNKLGEHKVLSIFLLGESGVGKTEVARALYKAMDGKKSVAKINFGNYSNEFSLSSLIGSARGYIGSDDGEIFIRVRNTDIGIILIDEFEKSNATLFNFFLDVLESGKMVSSQADEMNINGFIIIFTSNISSEQFPIKISPELRSRFDYKGHFTQLHHNDKERYVSSRIKSIIQKYNQHFNSNLDNSIVKHFVECINVDNYNNMRDLNKKIKIEFLKYIEIVQNQKVSIIRKFLSKINP